MAILGSACLLLACVAPLGLRGSSWPLSACEALLSASFAQARLTSTHGRKTKAAFLLAASELLPGTPRVLYDRRGAVFRCFFSCQNEGCGCAILGPSREAGLVRVDSNFLD